MGIPVTRGIEMPARGARGIDMPARGARGIEIPAREKRYLSAPGAGLGDGDTCDSRALKCPLGGLGALTYPLVRSGTYRHLG